MTEKITLKRIFQGDQISLSSEELTGEAVQKMTELKDEVSEKVKSMKFPMLFDEIVRKTDDLLNVNLTDIMGNAWKKYGELQQYRDTKKYPPTETFFVPLATHEIKSVHKPYVNVLINSVPSKKIEFEIIVSLIIEGMILKVQNAMIKEIKSGELKGAGEIKLEGVSIAKREMQPIPLPGSKDLGEGIAI